MYKQRNILELGLTFFLFSSRQGLGLVEESISPSCPCLFTSPPASFPSRSGFVNCLFFCPDQLPSIFLVTAPYIIFQEDLAPLNMA